MRYYKFGTWRWWLVDAWPMLLIIGVVLIILAMFVGTIRKRHACERAGGHMAKVNCGTEFILTPCGDNCLIPVPVEICDNVCAGANPEAP